MNVNSDDKQHYTGLILLSGIDTPGVASALFTALEPFSITLIDVEQLVIRSRLILTVLIDLDPAHAIAIEEDLHELSKRIDVDIAMSFGEQSAKSVAETSAKLRITISAEVLSPRMIAEFTTGIFDNAGNIQRIQRLASDPRTVLEFQISGVNKEKLSQDLKSYEDKFGVTTNLVENP
jgi:phosphoserine phosphatase